MKPRWSQPELEQLEALVGDLPWSIARNVYREWALSHGYPHRSDGALRLKAEALAGSRISCGEWLRLGVVQRELDIAATVTNRWVRSGRLPVHREGRGDGSACRHYVRRADLRRFAKRHPRHFAGKPREVLVALLDPCPLVDQLAAMPPAVVPGKPRPVQCLENGRIFPSTVAAARAAYVSPTAVRRAARDHVPTAGLHFAFLHP